MKELLIEVGGHFAGWLPKKMLREVILTVSNTDSTNCRMLTNGGITRYTWLYFSIGVLDYTSAKIPTDKVTFHTGEELGITFLHKRKITKEEHFKKIKREINEEINRRLK